MNALFRSVGIRIVSQTLLVVFYLAATIAVSSHAQELSREKVEVIRQSVVFIRHQNIQGTGFLMYRDGNTGLLATNAHVVEEVRNTNGIVRCVFHAGTQSEFTTNGELVGIDRNGDLAFVKVEQANLPPALKLDAKPELFETQNVVIAGFPFGSNLALTSVNPQLTISKGSISSLRRTDLRRPSLIQIDISVNPGNSGGPLFNSHGDVIGVITIKLDGTQLGFAIPSTEVHEALNGNVTAFRATNAVSPDGTPNFLLEAYLIDPLKKIESVQLNLVDEVDTKADFRSHDTWPELPSYMSISSQRIPGRHAEFHLDPNMKVRQPLIVQAVCYGTSGNMRVTRPFTLNLPISSEGRVNLPNATPPNSTANNPRSASDLSSPDLWVARIDLGPPLDSPSALTGKPSKGNTRKQPESKDSHAVDSDLGGARLAARAEYGESERRYALEAQPFPKINAMSESYLTEGWRVRRVLVPAEDISSIYFFDKGKSIVTHTRSQQALQRFDLATGKLTASFKIPGGFKSLHPFASGLLLLDGKSGEILVLNESLEAVRVMTCPFNPKLITSACSDIGVLATNTKPWQETTLCNFKLVQCFGIRDLPELAQDFTIVGDTLFSLSSNKIFRFAFDSTGKLVDQSSKNISEQVQRWITPPAFVPANDASVVAVAPQPLTGSPPASQSDIEILVWNRNLEELHAHKADLPLTLLNDSHWVSSSAGKLKFVSSTSKGTSLVMPGMASTIRQITSFGTNQVAVLSATGIFVAEREQ